MEELTQQIIHGLVRGGIYTLVATGLTLITGVLQVIDFAHGQKYMIGAYLGMVLYSYLGIGYFGSLIGAFFLAAIIGVSTERLIFRPLRGKHILNQLMASLGLAVLLQNLAQIVFGSVPRSFHTPYADQVVQFGSVSMSVQRIIIIIAAVILLIALNYLIRRTWLGLEIRSYSQDNDMARLVGVRVNKVVSYSFALAAGMAGVAGVLIAPIFVLQPTMGETLGLKAFVLVVIGGMGNIAGAIVSGFALGLIEGLAESFLFSGYRDIVAFFLLIVMLVFRPTGIFGKKM